MKKVFFILMALLVSAGFSSVFAADPTKPDLLSQGLDAFWAVTENAADYPTYDADSKTITFTLANSNIGWGFWGDGQADQVAEYQTCTIEFEPVNFDFEFVIADWAVAGKELGKIPVPAGSTKATIDIPASATNITIQFNGAETMPATLTLTSAVLSKTDGGETTTRKDLPLDKLVKNWGDGCTTDGNGSITFADQWQGAGWSLWTWDCSAYTKLVVNFDPLPYSVTVRVEYDDGLPHGDGDPAWPGTEETFTPGTTSAEITLDPALAAKVTQVYLMSRDDFDASKNPVVVKEAYFTAEEGGEVTDCPVIMDFSELPDGTNESDQEGWLVNGIMDQIATAKYLVIETEGIGDSAKGFGGLHLIYQGNNDDKSVTVGWQDVKLNGDWQDYTREDGKIVSIAINLENAIKSTSSDNYDYFLQCTGWARILLGYYGGASAFDGLGLTNVYLTNDFDKPDGAVDLAAGADLGFIFDGSISCAPTSEKIVLTPVVVLPAYGVTNGIVVNAVNENVSIYGIDGRLLKQVVANNQTIDMVKGLYIVKVGTAKAVKVVVK